MDILLETFDSLPFIRGHIEEHGYQVHECVDLQGLTVQLWCPHIDLAILFAQEGQKNNSSAIKKIKKDGIKLLVFNQQFVSSNIIAKRLKNITIDILTIESTRDFPETKLENQSFQEYLLTRQLQGQGQKVLSKGNLFGFDFSLMLPDFELIVQVDNLSKISAEQVEFQRLKLKTFRSNGYSVIQITHKQINASLRSVLASIEQAIIQAGKKIRKRKYAEKQLQKRLEKESRQKSIKILVNDPNWEALACKKLGIDTTKPKRTPING